MLRSPRPRRVHSVAAAVALALSASACTTGEAPPAAVSPTSTDPLGGELSCSEPPPASTRPASFSARPSNVSSLGRRFLATVQTTCGTLTIELFGDQAPDAVASFRFLADEGYWRSSPCHRLVDDAAMKILQCGDPTGTGRGEPGYRFGIENVPTDGSYPAGTVAMARGQDPGSNGGQFFISYGNTTISPSTGGYSVFGKVVAGLNIVRALAERGVSGQESPTQPISILSVSVTEKKA